MFQTKSYLRKNTAIDVAKQCNNAAVLEMKVGEAADSDRQNLTTDVCSSSDSLREAGADKSINLHNGVQICSSKTADLSSNSLFTPVTLFVNSQTVLNELVCKHYGSSSECSLMLTGLHTCGNLSSDILRLFVVTPSAEVVCQVGCCYNLLSERFLHVSDSPSALGNILFYSSYC